MIVSMDLRICSAGAALVSKDLTDVRLLMVFVLMVDVAIVLIAHLVLHEEYVALGVPSGRCAVALGVLSMLPVVAEIYSVDERVGAAGAMCALPLGRWTRAFSKVVAAGCALAIAVGVVILTQEILYVAGAGVDVTRLSRGFGERAVSQALVHPGFTNLGAIVMSTALFAVVVRHSLVATLAPIAAIGLLAAITYGLRHSGGAWLSAVMHEVSKGAAHPVGVVGAIVCLAAITPLRGVAARSVRRRAIQVFVVPGALVGVALAGLTLRETSREMPTFDDPRAQVFGFNVSPDGTRVAVCLWHHSWPLLRSSIWIADTTGWEFVRVSDELASTPWWRPSERLTRLGGWSTDGRRLMVCRSWEDHEGVDEFAVDPDSGVATPVSRDEYVLEVEYHGAPVRRIPGEGFDRHVELLDGSWRNIGNSLVKVPERANGAVFYLDDSRALHCLDRATGEDRVLAVAMDSRSWFQVGADGRFVFLSHGTRRKEVLEIATGRIREWDHVRLGGTRRGADGVAGVMPATRDGVDWILVTMDGEETVTFDPPC